MPLDDMPEDYMKMPKNYMKDTHDIQREAMKPVRKTEAGKYKGVDTSNLPAAGNDVDNGSARPDKSGNAAPDRKADIFAGKGSVADKLRIRRKKVESGTLEGDE